MSAEVADVLGEAADYIERHGLSRGTAVGPNGERCAVAACNQGARVVFNTGFDLSPNGAAMLASGEALDALARRLQIPRYDIAAWSDAAPVQEVLDAFRAAAKAERKAERKAADA